MPLYFKYEAPIDVAWRSFCTLMHFFCISSVDDELPVQQRTGTSAAQSPAFSAGSVGVVALIAGLGFHLKMDNFCGVTL